jgi:Zn-dependent protease
MTKNYGWPLALFTVGLTLVGGCMWLARDELGIEGIVMTPLGMPLFFIALIGGAAAALTGLVRAIVIAWRRQRPSLP